MNINYISFKSFKEILEKEICTNLDVEIEVNKDEYESFLNGKNLCYASEDGFYEIYSNETMELRKVNEELIFVFSDKDSEEDGYNFQGFVIKENDYIKEYNTNLNWLENSKYDYDKEVFNLCVTIGNNDQIEELTTLTSIEIKEEFGELFYNKYINSMLKREKRSLVNLLYKRY